MSKEIMRQALEFCQYAWQDIQMDEYAFEQLDKTIATLEAELAKPTNEFHPDWDTLKPYHDRIAELEAQLAKPEQPDLRKAAEMALETLEDMAEYSPTRLRSQITAIHQALAQPEHSLDKKADNARELGLDYEPERMSNQVWMTKDEIAKMYDSQPEQDHGFDRTASHMAGEYVDTANQEPVAWHSHNPDYPIQDGDWVEVIFTSGQPDDVKKWTPLYTAPQKPDVTLISEGKTWQGLTDDELDLIYKQHHNEYGQGVTGQYERAIEAKLKEKNT